MLNGIVTQKPDRATLNIVDVYICIPCKVDQIKKGCLHKLDHWKNNKVLNYTNSNAIISDKLLLISGRKRHFLYIRQLELLLTKYGKVTKDS